MARVGAARESVASSDECDFPDVVSFLIGHAHPADVDHNHAERRTVDIRNSAAIKGDALSCGTYP